MKKQWSLVGTLLLVLVIVIFSWLNVQDVTVNFGVAEVTMPLVVVLVIAVILGVILAALFSTVTILQQKQEIKHLQSKLDATTTMRRSEKNIKKEAAAQKTEPKK